MTRRFPAVLALLALSGAAAACASPAQGSAPRTTAPPSTRPARATTTTTAPHATPPALGWILTDAAFRALSADPSARRLFDDPRTYVIVTAGDLAGLRGWRCTPMAEFESYATMVQAFARGFVPAGVRAVMYDNEHWAATPLTEQRDPARYEALAAALVHAHHLRFVATPASDLVRVLDPANPHSGVPFDQFALFVALDVTGPAARHADLLEIQVQVQEPLTGVYDHLLAEAIAQARAANPRVVVYAGISTARAADPARSMLAAVRSSRGEVTGYWLNVPGNGPRAVAEARQFIDELAPRLTSGGP